MYAVEAVTRTHVTGEFCFGTVIKGQFFDVELFVESNNIGVK